MARGRTRLPATASIAFSYHSVADMPWENIESAARKPFSAEERREIFHCAEGYDWDEQHLVNAPELGDVDHLRNELIKHCDALIGLANRHRPMGPDSERQTSADVVSALQIYFGTEDFDFRDSFHRLGVSAGQMKVGLRDRPNFESDTTSVTPETTGLAGYIARVLDGATAKTARSAGYGNAGKPGLEYRRWGISVGPRASVFARFSSAVLQRNITSAMLRKAWPERR